MYLRMLSYLHFGSVTPPKDNPQMTDFYMKVISSFFLTLAVSERVEIWVEV